MSFVERLMRFMTHLNIGATLATALWVLWSGWVVVGDHRAPPKVIFPAPALVPAPTPAVQPATTLQWAQSPLQTGARP